MTQFTVNPVQYTTQDILNESFNDAYKILQLAGYQFDGTAFQPVSGGAQAIQLDSTTTANTVYVGVAPPGTATSSGSWQIQKIDTSSGVGVTWANGNGDYSNIWDNRASLSYS